MAPITGTILVKGVDPKSYLTKIAMRIYNSYGQIWGLAFEFSDGANGVIGRTVPVTVQLVRVLTTALVLVITQFR